MSRASALGWRCWHRTANRLRDALAVCVGACNASTWSGEGYVGGYAHWRCMRQRGHQGLHRFNNYVWGGLTEQVMHAPLEVMGLHRQAELHAEFLPFARWTGSRFGIERRGRQRIRQRVAEAARVSRG